MRSAPSLAAIFVSGVLLAPFSQAATDHRHVSVKFELDGNQLPAPDRIDLYLKSANKRIRCPIRDGLFEVPEVLLQGKGTVDISVRFKGRRVVFPDVFWGKFVGRWTIGIDTPPFASENASFFAAHESLPREIWFIAFSPPNEEGTREIVWPR